ncbi:MAG: hypothetical protein U1E65_34210 [Myxococcota bacterium]
MNRRAFLRFSAAGIGGFTLAAAGCSAGTEGLEPQEEADAGATPDAGATDAGAASPDAGTTPLDAGADGGTLFPDASENLPDASEPDAGLSPLTIRSAFYVVLNDTACSRHSHQLQVSPGTWTEDVELRFLGGSHEVRFRISELMRLEASELLPFATVGNGPGHGHCGTAWRQDTVGPEDPNRAQPMCTPGGTAMCLPG